MVKTKSSPVALKTDSIRKVKSKKIKKNVKENIATVDSTAKQENGNVPSKIKKMDDSTSKKKTMKRKLTENSVSEPIAEKKQKQEQDFISKLFVNGIPYHMGKNELLDYFSKYGTISQLMVAKKGKINRGFAFLQYEDESVMEVVLKEEHTMGKYTLYVRQMSKEAEPTTDQDTVKNKLYVSGLNTMTEFVKIKEYFSKFGTVSNLAIPKASQRKHKNKSFGFVAFEDEDIMKKVLDAEHELDGKKLAIKLAFKHVEQTKKQHSVQPNELFITGIGADTQKEEMLKHFETYGVVTRLSLPSSKVTKENRGFAFVKYEAEVSVDKVFKDKHVVDGCTLKVMYTKDKGDQNKGKSKDTDDCNSVPNQLFVGRLKRTTEVEAIKEYFGKFGTINKITLPKQHDQLKNKGFAFVVLDDEETIKKVLSIEEHKIDGQTVRVKIADISKDEKLKKKKSLETPNQLYMVGLDYSVTAAAIKEHFAKYGQVLKVSAPKGTNNDDNNRGFAFVNFKTEKSLLAALEDEHELGGRVLGVSRAKQNNKNEGSASNKVKKEEEVEEVTECDDADAEGQAEDSVDSDESVDTDSDESIDVDADESLDADSDESEASDDSDE